LAEAKRLGITTFGVVDTNCDPNKVDFAIPGNDDATKSIAIIANYLTAAIAEGLAERMAAKDEETEELSDDEKERKAARMEAEAQAEGGRGGRGRGAGGPGGAGGGGQRRRTPGGSGGGQRGGSGSGGGRR
jgi:small subunit ribosomal protein S2